MDIINSLLAFFTKPEADVKDETPEGVWPNCRQEYDNKIRDIYKDKQVDVNNQKAHYSFIQKFVVNYIDGIKLKLEENGWRCPNCSSVYTLYKIARFAF